MDTHAIIILAVLCFLVGTICFAIIKHANTEYFRNNLKRNQTCRYGKDKRKAKVIRMCGETSVVLVDVEDLLIVTVELNEVYPS